MIYKLLSPDYDVLTATPGLVALKMAREANPLDLILLDMAMHGMDGYEVCRILKDDNAPICWSSRLSSIA